MVRVAILTISDRCAQNERENLSGPAMEEMLPDNAFEVCERVIVPDEMNEIVERLAEFSDRGGVDLVLTTGGTGFGPRDVTPEATA